MAALKNIIFDLGGVLINLDYKKTEDAFIALGYENFHAMYSQFTADELFRRLETGRISNEEFYTVLRRAHANEVSEEEVRNAWNSMLLSWREESLCFLETLRPEYRIFLLSNTNAVHSDSFHQSLKAQTGRDTIDPLFEKAYWSHEINMRKPDRETFEFVQKDAGIIPPETLFIDDSVNNIEIAAAMGFKTHLLLAEERIEELDYKI